MPPYYMAVTNTLGKEFFRLLKKNISSSSNLYKIFNKDNVKFSNRCMANVSDLINNSA